VSLDRRQIREIVAIVVGGALLRLAVALVSRGSNDIISWEDFGDDIAKHGLIWMYQNVPWWNHPPLMGYLAEGLRALALAAGWPFAPTFKLVPIAGDMLSALLVFWIWLGKSGDYRAARGALVIFTLSLDAVLVSGYHGNTDPLVAALLLAACFAVDRGRHFTGGVVLAAAVNVKLIPLLVVPLLIARLKPREIARFVAGGALGVLPFLPVVWLAGESFVKNAIAYRSNFENWGIPLSIRALASIGRDAHAGALERIAEVSRTVYIRVGPILIVLAVLALAAYARSRRWSSVYERVALGLALFLILTPGFGVQYTAILGPVLLAHNRRWGLRWAMYSGLFLFAVYATFYLGGFPLKSTFYSAYRPLAAVIGILPWALLVAFAWVTLRQSRREAVRD